MTGHLIIDFEGTQLTPVEREILAHPLVCGVIFFARNYENREQIKSMVKEIRQVKPNAIITVDQEGGRVQRFQEGFTKLPALGELSKDYPDNFKKVIQALHQHAYTMVTELKNVGVDLSFTPVLDRNLNNNDVIADRSFSRDPQNIIELALSYINAMHKAGMPATGKHFPGHGAVSADSHLELPVDEREYNTIFNTELRPFIALSRILDAIMPAHVVYPAIDKMPAGFSRIWLQDILRDQLHFDGVIFSDDLTMRATAVFGGYDERAGLAFEAGCDIILVCNHPPGVAAVIDAHGNYRDTQSEQRIAQLIEKLRD